jgi:class 3 adenylate cyclase/tetratricopeptide (TPR) repeat protein
MREPREGGGHPITILFTDVQGSTQLRARHGDRVADEILHDHEGIVRRAVEAHGGDEAAFLGDGFMLTFASPADGLRCAIAIQQDLQRYGRDNADRRVRVRIGLHQGEATERDGTLYGQAVNAASRVMSEAAGGQILVTAAVHDAVAAAGFSFVDRGLYWLRGFPDRWRLYEAEWGRDDAGGAIGPAQTPFVGRERERADLRRAVEDARVGHGSLVLVTGEAGVGKTRLVQEVDAEADAHGLRVLVGHSTRDEGRSPYLPFTEMIEQGMVTPRSPATLRRALGEAAPEIARIAPALRLVVPEIPAPLDLPPEQARRYLWLSMREFIGRAAEDRPLLLVFEDLHWADESTLLLLEYLAPSLPEMPVMIVGTFRDDEIQAGSPLARILNQLVRERLVTRVPLRRLTEEVVASLVAGLTGQRPPAALVRGIYAQSEGNPFFAEEIYLHLAESGVLFDDQGRFRGDLRVEDLEVPSSVRMVIGERLGRLSEATQRALVAAAVRGRVFELELVERVAGDPGGDLLDAFDEAERARLITPSKSEPSSYAFTHELIRQTLLAGASTVRRRRLHLAIADALEAIHADDLEAHAADLAFHLAHGRAGGRDGRLVRYLRMAGDRAMDTAAYAEAVEHFAQAVSLLERQPEAGEEERGDLAELVERLAMALRSQGRWDEALKVMDEALRLYESLGRADALGRLCGAMSYQLGWAAKWEEAVAVASRGLAALGDLPNPDRARLLAAAAWVSGLAGDYAGATGMFAGARELATQLGDESALADVLQLQTIHHMAWVELADGVAAGLRAAEVYEATGDLWDLTGVLAFAEYQHKTLARPEPTAAHAARLAGLAERVAPMAEHLGHLGAEFLVVASRIRIEGVYRADLAFVERMGRHVVEVCERGGLPWLYVGHLYLGLAAHWRGDWETAERELRLADQLEAPGAIGGQSAAHLALHLAHAGRGEEVAAIVEAHRPGFPVAGAASSIGAWNMLLGFVEALALTGRADEVAALRPLLDDALALDDWISFDGRLVATRAAIAATAARDWEAAERHLATAQATAEALGNRIEQADLGFWGSRMLRDRDAPGDREAAAALAAETAARYRDLGLPGRFPA